MDQLKKEFPISRPVAKRICEIFNLDANRVVSIQISLEPDMPVKLPVEQLPLSDQMSEFLDQLEAVCGDTQDRPSSLPANKDDH